MMYNDKTVKERIEEIVGFQRNGEIMKFFPPVTDKEMSDFEKENDITIPESYKEWLRFSNGGVLFEPGGARLYSVMDSFRPDVGYDLSNGIVPKEYLIIGYWESQYICYNKITGKFFFYEYVEPVIYFDDFSGILAYIIDICTN